jgi:hypothetical protein
MLTNCLNKAPCNGPDVMCDASGNSFAVWLRSDVKWGGSGRECVVQYASNAEGLVVEWCALVVEGFDGVVDGVDDAVDDAVVDDVVDAVDGWL